MKNTEDAIPFPLQITFRNAEAQPQVEDWIRAEAGRLARFYGRIMGCRVAVSNPHRHHREGRPYHVRIDITVPGGELIIRHAPNLRSIARQSGELALKKHLQIREPQKRVGMAIHEAFKAAGRKLQDYARRQRGDVKSIDVLPRARVTQLFPDKDSGFLITADGRDIYFHKDSVLNEGFSRLRVGSLVTFAEEQGNEGPQASSVRILRRHGLQFAAA